MVNYFWQKRTSSFSEKPSEFFALSGEEKNNIREKRAPHNQIIYAILLKYFECERRFPDPLIENFDFAHKILTEQLEIPFEKLIWPSERTVKRFRANIRNFLGYREITHQDKIDLSYWLSKYVLPHAPDEDALLEATEFFCENNKIEVFANYEMERFLTKESNAFEQKTLNKIFKSISSETKKILDQILEEQTDSSDSIQTDNKFILSDLKKNTSHLKKDSIVYEIAKHEFLKNICMSEILSDTHSRKFLLKYVGYVKTRFPSDLKIQPDELRYSQLAIFCDVKRQESADIMVDILLKTLHKIRKKAQKHVEQYALSEIKKARGKFDTLLTLAETLKDYPKGIIENTVYPRVSTTELDNIIADLHHRQKWFQNQVRVKALSLYNYGHRKTLKDLLKILTFETDRKDLHNLLLAIEWIKTDEGKRDVNNLPYLDTILRSWGSLVKKEEFGKEDISLDLNAYELAVLEHFSQELSVKNIWVKGAYKYQNPTKDMPTDFEEKKAYYFELLNTPKNPDDFIASMKKELEENLILLNENLPNNEKVTFVKRKNGAIKLSPSDPQELSINLASLHQEINQHWPNVPLIDLLKEVDFRVGFTNNFTGLGAHSTIPKVKLQKRLLFCIYGLGSNIGLKRLATSSTGETYSDLRYTKNRYLSPDHIRSAIRDIVNALLKIRDPEIWLDNNVGCACDSKRINVWLQNLFGGWHGRYREHGVMIYTHIDKKSAPIYMQITRPGDSEVGSMLTGCLHHDTEMDMNEIHTDTHGQSSIGFAFSRLLNFDLLPRIKGINKQKLFVPSRSFKEMLSNLQLALANDPINWKKIEDNYEEVVKHTVALRTRTVEADVLLKRLSADNGKNPVYQALLEIGKVERTIFLCRYLSDENLRIQINEALNVVERFNGIMSFVFNGKQGIISTNDTQDQEIIILCLHLIMVCITYVNTLMIQEVIGSSLTLPILNEHDLRALTPLIHEHLNPHGILSLNMEERLKMEIMEPAKIRKEMR